MGSFFSRIYFKLFGRSQTRILILGLENAGKTTFLYNLIFPKPIETIPSNLYSAIGFNIETLTFQGLTLQMWDLGGQQTFRQQWKSYFPNTQGLVYIIDSSDPARLELSKSELLKLLQEEDLRSVPLLILANKQDLAESLPAEQIEEYFNIQSLDRRVRVFPVSSGDKASSGQALEWLVEALSNN